MKVVLKKIAVVAVALIIWNTVSVAQGSEDVQVFIDGAEKNLSPSAMISNDRTMVPLRGIFENLGANVDWSEETQTISVTKGSTNISLVIGEDNVKINGTDKELDTPAIIKEDRTMVPLRFLSEALSCDVYWDGTRNAVDIYNNQIGDIKDTNGRLARKAVMNDGDTSAIENAMLKAKNGQDITIGFIGGSITEWSPTSEKTKYPYIVEQWWKQKFPNTNVTSINAGIGSTGSLLGVHRVDANLLNKNPDFVVVDYAVNDDPIKTMQPYYEQLVRKILKSENHPGLMLLFMVSNNGTNAQQLQGEIGTYYNLPMISYKNAMWPEFKAKNIKWELLHKDTVHPNDEGQYLVAKFITNKLDRIYEGLTRKKEVSEIKEPLFPPEKFVDAKTLCSDVISPITNEGWKLDTDAGFAYNWRRIMPLGWEITDKNKPVVFEVEGNTIGIVYKKTEVKTVGRVSVKIDDLKPVIVEGYGGWTYPQGQIIADNLPDGKHRVEIILLEEHNAACTGETFTVDGLLVSKIIH